MPNDAFRKKYSIAASEPCQGKSLYRNPGEANSSVSLNREAGGITPSEPLDHTLMPKKASKIPKKKMAKVKEMKVSTPKVLKKTMRRDDDYVGDVTEKVVADTLKMACSFEDTFSNPHVQRASEAMAIVLSSIEDQIKNLNDGTTRETSDSTSRLYKTSLCREIHSEAHYHGWSTIPFHTRASSTSFR